MSATVLASMINQATAAKTGAGAEELLNKSADGTAGADADGSESEFVSALNDSVVDTTDQSVVDAQTAEPKDDEPASDKEPKSSDLAVKEKITVTDHKGKREIEVDFSNRDKIKQAYQMAAGMRKFQMERDQANQKHEAASKELGEFKTRFERLEQIWREQGENGIIRLLSDGKRDLDAVVQERMTRAERRAKADPAELEKMDLQEQMSSRDSEASRLAARVKELEGKLESNLTQAETQKLESVIHPSFDKFRFEGKLGNEEDELMLDEMMWKRATAKFDEYQKQGVSLTQDLVDREFKKQSVAMSRLIKQETDKKVTAAIQDKKSKALETAQRTVSRGFSSSKEDADRAKALESGDFRSFFKGFGKGR